MSELSPSPEVAPFTPEQVLACAQCDLLMRRPAVSEGHSARCSRCGNELFNYRNRMVQRSLALVITALLLYVPANFLPIMYLNLLGRASDDTVWSGVLGLYENGMHSVAVLVFLCSMAVPLLKLLCQLAVLLSLQLKVARPAAVQLYRVYHHLREWGMLEVYLMGILVSLVKLAGMADLSVGVGLFCFVALLMVQVWLEVTMSPSQVWHELTESADEGA